MARALELVVSAAPWHDAACSRFARQSVVELRESAGGRQASHGDEDTSTMT